MRSQTLQRLLPGNAVVMISFPHQLLHALCALEHDRECRGVAKDSPVTLVLWSYHARDHAPDSRARQFFAAALQRFPYIQFACPTLQERKGPLSPYRKLMKRAHWIRQFLKLAPGACPGFYYAHDASADHTAQAFMQALQAETNICYGDAPGFLYPMTKPERGPLRLSLRSLKDAFWATRISDVTTWYAAKTAIIAVDFAEHAQGLNLPEPVLIPPEIFSRTLSSLKSSFPEITHFEQHVLRAAQHEPIWLLILSNFSSSKLTSEENELALYSEICKTHIPPHGWVYIKKHAGTRSPFIEQLTKQLSVYKTEAFPHHLEHLPIELFCELHHTCRIISVSSASALLTLVSGANITHALTEQHIEQRFNPAHRAYMTLANARIQKKSSQE